MGVHQVGKASGVGRLERLLRPRSIAVFGGREAERAIEQCERIGYTGELWPVHPHRDRVAGRACFRDARALPQAPDAAFVGVNRRASIAVMRSLAQRGCGGAVAYAAGFAETGAQAHGERLQRELVEAAGAMPVLGPNCYGLINYLDGALLWPDQHGGQRVESGVAIIAQSSNIAINLTMQRRGLPIAYLVTVGNQAQTDVAGVIRGVLGDERVTAIGLYLEGIRDVRELEDALAASRERGVPVVALKAGRSEQARAATLSHTASLAGSERAVDVFFERLGAARVRTLPQLLETLKLLHVHGPLSGAKLCSMSCSGGEAALMADTAAGRTVSFPALGEAVSGRVQDALGELVTVANPLDYHTFAWGDEPALRATFTAMLEGGFDLSLLVLDVPRSDRCDDTLWRASTAALAGAVDATSARAAVVASLSDNMPESWALDLIGHGIAPLCGMSEALDAAEAATFIGQAWRTALPAPLAGPGPAQGERDIIHEWQAKRLLADHGLAIPEGRLCADAAGAARAAQALGFPVAVKLAAVAHKSDADGVRLGLHDAHAVGEAAAELIARSGSGVLVERMVSDAVAELMVGVSHDAQFGALLTIGAGGVWVELLADTVSLLLPTDETQVRSALRRLRMWPLMQGYRRGVAGDVDGAVEAILSIARFAGAYHERLYELDVNPLLVRPVGCGAIAADALIVMGGKTT